MRRPPVGYWTHWRLDVRPNSRQRGGLTAREVDTSQQHSSTKSKNQMAMLTIYESNQMRHCDKVKINDIRNANRFVNIGNVAIYNCWESFSWNQISQCDKVRSTILKIASRFVNWLSHGSNDDIWNVNRINHTILWYRGIQGIRSNRARQRGGSDLILMPLTLQKGSPMKGAHIFWNV